jgi:hypothetical protein
MRFEPRAALDVPPYRASVWSTEVNEKDTH